MQTHYVEASTKVNAVKRSSSMFRGFSLRFPLIGVSLSSYSFITFLLSFQFLDITKIGDSLQRVNGTSNTLKSLATELNNTINSINSNISQAEADCKASANLSSSSLCNDIGSNFVTTNIDYNQFPNVDDEFARVDDVIKKNLTAQIQEVRENPNLLKIYLYSFITRAWLVFDLDYYI